MVDGRRHRTAVGFRALKMANFRLILKKDTNNAPITDYDADLLVLAQHSISPFGHYTLHPGDIA